VKGLKLVAVINGGITNGGITNGAVINGMKTITTEGMPNSKGVRKNSEEAKPNFKEAVRNT
jgi:hypothetical protein